MEFRRDGTPVDDARIDEVVGEGAPYMTKLRIGTKLITLYVDVEREDGPPLAARIAESFRERGFGSCGVERSARAARYSSRR